MVIHDVRVDISPRTIDRLLYGLEYQSLVNIGEIDYRMEEMRKITKRTFSFEEKMVIFR